MNELSKAEIGAEKIDAAQHSLDAGDVKPGDVLSASGIAFASLVLALSQLLARDGGAALPAITIQNINVIAAGVELRAVLASIGTFKAALEGLKGQTDP